MSTEQANFDEVMQILDRVYYLNAEEQGTDMDPRPWVRAGGYWEPAKVQAVIDYDTINGPKTRVVTRDTSNIWRVDALKLPVLSEETGRAYCSIEYFKTAGGRWLKQVEYPKPKVKEPKVIPELSHLPRIR